MAHSIVALSEGDLLARMRNYEDHFVERKTIGDSKDWTKTAVAFANSAPIGFPAVLYIGVLNDGTIETPQKDLDEVQKKFNWKMTSVYPRIPYIQKVITEKGLQAVAVVIPGSQQRPHFSGLSYVRTGSETREASTEQYEQLIAQRSSKAGLILQSKGMNVTVINRNRRYPGHPLGASESQWGPSTVLVDCNQFYVTLLQSPTAVPSSFPLSIVEINWDNLRHRLQLELRA